jgi:hypothetical protein
MHTVPLNINTPDGVVRVGDARVELLADGSVGNVTLLILHPLVLEAIKGLKEWEEQIVLAPSLLDLADKPAIDCTPEELRRLF